MHRIWMAVLLWLGGLGAQALAADLVFLPSRSGVSINLNAVAYGADSSNFVAVGSGLLTLSSPSDGQVLSLTSVWAKTNITNGPILGAIRKEKTRANVNLRSVVYGDGRFLAAGTNAVFSSTDGVHWLQQGGKVFSIFEVGSMAFSPSAGSFVAASRSDPVALRSALGLWSASQSKSQDWGKAKLPKSLFESWKAICAMDGQNLAICGSGGAIRTSTDGGANWVTRKKFGNAGVRLKGIAWGGGKLVAVGEDGQFRMSLDRGANWGPVKTAEGSGGKHLNAVAYTGDGFLAVGNGGKIIFSNDGNTWRPLGEAGVTANLTGIAVSPKGTVVVVGEKGTILMGTHLPEAAVSLVDPNQSTICDDEAVMIQAVLKGCGPWDVTWWDNAVSNNVTTNVLTRTVMPSNPNPDSAWSNKYTVTRLVDATGFVTTNASLLTSSATITVNPLPKAMVSRTGPDTICNGGATTIQAVLSGIGPWDVMWSDGFPQSNVTNRTITRMVSPTNPNPDSAWMTNYTVTNLTANGCMAPASNLTGTATIIVNPRPTAVVSLTGTNTICNGGATTIQANLTGLGPWNVTWSDGLLQNNVTTSPAVRMVNPANPNDNTAWMTNYTVTNLTTANGCRADAGELTGGASITVNPRPTAVVSLTGASTICNGGMTTVEAALTGIGPWDVMWSDGFPQNNVTTSPAVRTVVPASPNANTPWPTNYTVMALTTANGCAADVMELTGGASITVNPRPTAVVTGTTNICNGDMATIQASLSGIGPWNVMWSDGVVSNNVTTNVHTRTVMPANPDANTAWITNYTVTVLTTTNVCSANAGELTGSASITINPRPKAIVSATGPTTICDGGMTTIQADLTGIGPWNVIWSDGTNQLNVTSSPATRMVSPGNSSGTLALTNTYTVTNLTTTNGCSAEAGDLSGSAAITVSPRLAAVVTLAGASNTCNGGSTTIRATLSGTSPWNVTWSDGVVSNNVTTNVITRTVSPLSPTPTMPWMTNYTVTALSNPGCSAAASNLTGSAMITIRPSMTVGVVAQAEPGCSVQLTANPTNGSGSLAYSWSPATHLDNTNTEVVVSTSPTNITYTVTVTDLINTNGCTAQASVTVVPFPEAAVIGTNTICNGGTATIQANLSGLGPWNVMWSDGFSNQVSTSPAIRMVSPASPNSNSAWVTNYTITNLTMSGCSATNGGITGMASITVNPRPKAAVVGTTTICNGGMAMIQASLSGLGPWNVTWSDGFSNQVTTSPATRTVAPVNASANSALTNSYTVTNLTTTNGCSAEAGDLTGSAMIAVTPQPGAMVTLAGASNTCNGGSTTIRATLSGTGPWNVTWSDGVVSTNVTTNVITRTVSPLSPTPTMPWMTNYTVTALSNPGCSAVASNLTGSAMITIRPSMTVGVALLAEPGCSVQLTANPTNGSAILGYSWSPGTHLDNTNTMVVVSTSPTNITYTVTVTDLVNTNGCTAQASVTVVPFPQAVVTGTTNICFGGLATIQANLSGLSPWNVMWSDGFSNQVSTSPAIRMVSPASPNPNSAWVTNYTITNLTTTLGCRATTGGITGMASITVSPQFTANAGPSVTIPASSSTNLGAMPPATGGTPPYTYSWSPTTALNDPSSNNPTATPLTNTTYTVTVTDSNGCTATASIIVNVAGLFTSASLAGPQLRIRVLDASRVQLSWDGEYHLQMATNLSESGASMAWANVHTNVVSGLNQVTNAVSGGGAFFRLRSP